MSKSTLLMPFFRSKVNTSNVALWRPPKMNIDMGLSQIHL